MLFVPDPPLIRLLPRLFRIDRFVCSRESGGRDKFCSGIDCGGVEGFLGSCGFDEAIAPRATASCFDDCAQVCVLESRVKWWVLRVCSLQGDAVRENFRALRRDWPD